MEKRGHNALFPFPFMVGAGVVVAIWLIGVYLWERMSNFLVTSSLLVSSQKPHLITLPMSDVGMDWRTLGALFGVIFVVGGVFTFFGHIGHTDRNTVDEIQRPARPARESMRPMDSYGMDSYGMDPMMGMPPQSPLMMGMPPSVPMPPEPPPM